MSAWDWYVVNVDRHYYIAPTSNGHITLTPLAAGITPPRGFTNHAATACRVRNERVVSRDDLLALIAMAQAQHAMEGT